MMRTQAVTVVFGLVQVPAKVTGLVASNTTPLKNLHDKCLTPVSKKTWCAKCDKALDPEEVVKGTKVGAKYVVVPADQLEATKVERSNIITITKFVTAAAVDFEQYASHYHLIPDTTVNDAYWLLEAGLVKKDMIGVGSTTLWGKEHPVVVQPWQGGLLLSFLHVVEDMVDRPYLVPDDLKLSKEMLGLAGELIDRQAGTLISADVTSQSRAKREQLVEQIAAKVEALPPTTDLLSILRLSVGGKKKPTARKKVA